MKTLPKTLAGLLTLAGVFGAVLFIRLIIGGKSRQGWEAAFKKQTGVTEPEGDLFEGLTNQFDEEEWKW